MKSISVAQQAALDAAHCLPVLFAEIDWAEGLARYVTAGANIAWNGFTWLGIGSVVDISPIVETDSPEATGVRFSLPLIGSSQVSQGLSTQSQGRSATLWLGILERDPPYALIGTPIREFEGRLDAPALVDGETSVISISAESRMATLLGAEVRRYTDQDQRKFNPGDTFFEHIASMAERLIVFPSAEALRR